MIRHAVENVVGSLWQPCPPVMTVLSMTTSLWKDSVQMISIHTCHKFFLMLQNRLLPEQNWTSRSFYDLIDHLSEYIKCSCLFLLLLFSIHFFFLLFCVAELRNL